MARLIPTRAHAEGMLAAITAMHVCGEACTATVVLGDGTPIVMKCPWQTLDLASEADRLIVQTCYAETARAILDLMVQ